MKEKQKAINHPCLMRFAKFFLTKREVDNTKTPLKRTKYSVAARIADLRTRLSEQYVALERAKNDKIIPEINSITGIPVRSEKHHKRHIIDLRKRIERIRNSAHCCRNPKCKNHKK